jgi:hypothetical protein
MDIHVTRQIRITARAQGSGGRSYSSNNNSIAVIQESIKNVFNQTQYAQAITPDTFVLAFNFKMVKYYEYICPQDMVIMEQDYQNAAVTFQVFIGGTWVAYTLGQFLSQYERIRIIPTVIGLNILSGYIQAGPTGRDGSNSVDYIEVSWDSVVIPFTNTNNPSVDNYQTLYAENFGKYPKVMLIIRDSAGNDLESPMMPKRINSGGLLQQILWDVGDSVYDKISGNIVLTK